MNDTCSDDAEVRDIIQQARENLVVAWQNLELLRRIIQEIEASGRRMDTTPDAGASPAVRHERCSPVVFVNFGDRNGAVEHTSAASLEPEDAG